jgi:hypothetical protein
VTRATPLALLLLVLAQAAHSVEESVARLYDVFAPARFVSALVSRDLAVGFLVVNISLVAFGFWCRAVPVRRLWRSAAAFAWFWALLELANGTAHLFLAVSRGGYFPGALTAPLLLGFAAWLSRLLVRGADPRAPDARARPA